MHSSESWIFSPTKVEKKWEREINWLKKIDNGIKLIIKNCDNFSIWMKRHLDDFEDKKKRMDYVYGN